MHRRQRLRHLGLADARFALEQQRTPQQLHQRDRGRKLSVGDVAGFSQSLRDLLAVLHCQNVFLFASSPLPPREAVGRGRGGGGGGGAATSEAAVPAETPPPPDPSPPRAKSAWREG